MFRFFPYLRDVTPSLARVSFAHFQIISEILPPSYFNGIICLIPFSFPKRSDLVRYSVSKTPHVIRRLPSQLSCIFPQAVFVIRTQTMIHRFPSKSTAHSQKTFVSNLTRKRRITNKSPFKDVYPLINADSLMTNICNVVREIFAIILSVMVIQTQNFINFTRTLRFWQCCKTETSWFKISNHDDDEEKTDRKAKMVYSYWIFFLSSF